MHYLKVCPRKGAVLCHNVLQLVSIEDEDRGELVHQDVSLVLLNLKLLAVDCA